MLWGTAQSIACDLSACPACVEAAASWLTALLRSGHALPQGSAQSPPEGVFGDCLKPPQEATQAPNRSRPGQKRNCVRRYSRRGTIAEIYAASCGGLEHPLITYTLPTVGTFSAKKQQPPRRGTDQSSHQRPSLCLPSKRPCDLGHGSPP